MNSKSLALLGVFVALLSGWLVISLLAQPNVSLESKEMSAAKPGYVEPTKKGDAYGSVKNGESGLVQTSVTIPTENIQTSVKIKK